MRILRPLLLLFIFTCMLGNVQAQDIHFSQYNMSPLTLNPALTGSYSGTFRVGGIYRDQWASVIDNQFVTPSVYADAPLLNIGKTGWLGLGAVFLSDKAGTAGLSNTSIMGSLAYHIGLNKKQTTVLTFGVQAGQVQKRIDRAGLTFADQFNGNAELVEQVSLNETSTLDKVSYIDVSAGTLLKLAFSEKVRFNAGFSVAHLTRPVDEFIGNAQTEDQRLDYRYTGHGGLDIDFGEKITLSPSVLYQTQSNASELNAQALLGYHLNKEKTTTLSFGGGYRLGDAAIAMLGLDIKGFKFGAAYDINLSDLNNVSKSQGGFEIALSYIAKIYKKPTAKPIIFCPRF